MKQADFRDVPDELWERIKPLLPSSNKKEETAADSFHSVLFCRNLLQMPERRPIGYASRVLWLKKYYP